MAANPEKSPNQFGPLTHQQQTVLKTLEEHNIKDEGLALSAKDAIQMAADENHDVFSNRDPSSSSCAAIMTSVYRKVPGLHRVDRGDGTAGFKYFYNPEIQMVKSFREHTVAKPAPAPAPKPAKVKAIAAPAKRAYVRKEKPAPSPRTVKLRNVVHLGELRIPQTGGSFFEMVKKPDGTPAGVVKDGILYDTLEVLLTALNGFLKQKA